MLKYLQTEDVVNGFGLSVVEAIRYYHSLIRAQLIPSFRNEGTAGFASSNIAEPQFCDLTHELSISRTEINNSNPILSSLLQNRYRIAKASFVKPALHRVAITYY